MKVLEKAIEMVAVSGKGVDNVSPIRFRLEENEELRVIKIKKIMTKDKIKLAGKVYLVFTCLVVINDIEKICEIRFDKMATTWILYKI